MRPSEYLDALRVKLNAPSDYALQKPLGVTKAAISKYRNNRAHFDDDVCIRVAQLLGKEQGFVILDMHMERAKTPQERAAWQMIFQGFLTLLLPANGKGFSPIS